VALLEAWVDNENLRRHILALQNLEQSQGDLGMDTGTARDFGSGRCGVIQRYRGEAYECIARLMSTGSGREATSRFFSDEPPRPDPSPSTGEQSQ
jgi:hypothetical protein